MPFDFDKSLQKTQQQILVFSDLVGFYSKKWSLSGRESFVMSFATLDSWISVTMRNKKARLQVQRKLRDFFSSRSKIIESLSTKGPCLRRVYACSSLRYQSTSMRSSKKEEKTCLYTHQLANKYMRYTREHVNCARVQKILVCAYESEKIAPSLAKVLFRRDSRLFLDILILFYVATSCFSNFIKNNWIETKFEKLKTYIKFD